MMNVQRLEQQDLNTLSVVRGILCGLVMMLGVGGMATYLSDDTNESATLAQTESENPQDDTQLTEDETSQEFIPGDAVRRSAY